MSWAMQGKLLRVLQEGEYFPVGDTKVRKANVRIIAAAKDSLPENVETGVFREDLYYRINVVQISVPPLYERAEDIPLLIDHFLKHFSDVYGKRIKGISKTAENILLEFPWPGNVRQLENVIRRTVLFAKEDSQIEVHHLPKEILEGSSSFEHSSSNLAGEMGNHEKKFIKETLIKCGWNRSETCRRLGISRSALLRKMKVLDIREDE